MKLKNIYLLIFVEFTVNIIQFANGDGMIEVFGWKQMDFYNRGDRVPNDNGNIGGAVGDGHQNRPPCKQNNFKIIITNELHSITRIYYYTINKNAVTMLHTYVCTFK